MKRIILAIAAIAFFAGCETAPTNPSSQSTEKKPTNSKPIVAKENPAAPAPATIWDQIAAQYNYFRDKRTSNVCIGMWRNDYRTTFYVPCDQVQHLLKNP